MQSEWPRKMLKEAGVALIDCDHKTPPAADFGFPYVAIPQVKNGRINLAGVRWISETHFREWTKKAHPQAHDVVLSRRCNPGESAYVPETFEFALGQNLVLLRADGQHIFPPFLRWLARGPQWWEQVNKFINVGAVFDSLRCADIPKFELTIPPLEAQAKISEILGSLDRKIELNFKMNETLDKMARAIFKSWLEKEAARGGLSEVLVSDLATTGILQIGDGYRAKNIEMADSGLPFARAGNVDNGFNFDGADLLGSDGVAKAGVKVSQAYDVVFTSKGTVGRFAFVDPSMPAFVYSPQLCFWRSINHNALNPYILFQWMRSRWFLDQVDRVKGQTDMAEYVSLRDQRAMRFPLASPQAQVAIGNQLGALQLLVWNNERESSKLSKLRDLLLPRLLSGELTIKVMP